MRKIVDRVSFIIVWAIIIALCLFIWYSAFIGAPMAAANIFGVVF